MFSYVTSLSNNEIDAIAWHARLGHIGQQIKHKLAKEDMLSLLTKVELPICENRIAEKTIRIKAKNPLQIIYSNICGPMNVKAKHGASYFIIFINDYFEMF